MKRVLVGLVIVVVAGGCQGSTGGSSSEPATAESVALQSSDVRGMQRCKGSGDVESVLQTEKVLDPRSYAYDSSNWATWKDQGAAAGFASIYAQIEDDCPAVNDAGAYIPNGRLMISLVVKFKDQASAAQGYAGGLDLFGFGPTKVALMLFGGTSTTGSSTGLGTNSVVGTNSPGGILGGTTFYVAFWQRGSFESTLVGLNVANADGAKAVKNINARIN